MDTRTSFLAGNRHRLSLPEFRRRTALRVAKDKTGKTGHGSRDRHGFQRTVPEFGRLTARLTRHYHRGGHDEKLNSRLHGHAPG